MDPVDVVRKPKELAVAPQESTGVGNNADVHTLESEDEPGGSDLGSDGPECTQDQDDPVISVARESNDEDLPPVPPVILQVE
ncbi:hypothetical protein M404DRAFT_24744 [Pisolithus tinctorius Marx 270]|uniref:Uncharacterized protein n=1 Tax=Pisolithus tinctorius Marx 270 TaxID=870435 RepID=A0A0C3P0A3_PISTI|nr:hypothetical protein M404DRAFT_24744 [Pisolithus tinctorius Marx 270]